jgi:uncharacterized protein YidB (DUF937 family)
MSTLTAAMAAIEPSSFCEYRRAERYYDRLPMLPTRALRLLRYRGPTTVPVSGCTIHSQPSRQRVLRPTYPCAMLGSGWGKGGASQEALMGMLDDILRTIQTSGAASDPRAKPVPAPAPGGTMAGHAMSPMAKALLALLAIYAAKNLRRAPSAGTSPASPTAPPPGTTTAGGGGLDDLLKGPLGDLLRGGTATGTATGGGLGDLLKGPLGGILGGAAAGTILNGGLGDLLKQLQQSGQADAVNSWVGSGPNKTISQTDLGGALGIETLDQLSNYSGMQRGEMLAGLSDHLPRVVDALTPQGRMLTNQEAERML